MSLEKEAYEQNYQQFRSLNQIMWQIPVLAMTLTGGLWFGVSRISDNSILVTVLLITAVIGNLILLAVLMRFRHVMGCYLAWLKNAHPTGFVDASPIAQTSSRLERLCSRDKTVRTLFSLMLGWAALGSFIVLAAHWIGRLDVTDFRNSTASVAYYDRHAVALADGYESIDFESAYPFLVDFFDQNSDPIQVLDVGSGTGRDAAWIAARGHSVVAVEPSTAMLQISQRLHTEQSISWVQDSLPSLDHETLKDRLFDVILINAVWMHITPEQRRPALSRVRSLLMPGGQVFVSLRLGPSSAERGMYEMSSSEFVEDAQASGFNVTPVGDFSDLLGRPEVSWKVFKLMSRSP